MTAPRHSGDLATADPAPASQRQLARATNTWTPRDRGLTLVELMVALTIFLGVGTVMAALLNITHGTFGRETERQINTTHTRIALERAVRSLREHGARAAAVNLILRNPAGLAVIVDGTLFWADSNHRTVYVDADTNAKPDFAGYDDLDGDGKSDVLGYALMPEDDDGNGAPDFLDANRDGKADDIVKLRGANDGYYDHYYSLVTKRFRNMTEALNYVSWQTGVTVVARRIIPFVTWRGTGAKPLPPGPITKPPIPTTVGLAWDTIEVEGIAALTYDYGRDGVPNTGDTGEKDGVVEELEIAQAVTVNKTIDGTAELDLIGTMKFNLRRATPYGRGRIDVQSSYTAVAPRAITVRRETGLSAPIPVL